MITGPLTFMILEERALYVSAIFAIKTSVCATFPNVICAVGRDEINQYPYSTQMGAREKRTS
jgi:hypothetical protein